MSHGERHLYTAWPVGARGAPGFQTIACGKKLEPRLRALERLVENYRPEEGDGAGQSFQLAPLGETENFSVLTWFRPLGKTPEGRPGNSWAESLVVPSAWLGSVGWDLETVLGALSSYWLGPDVRDEVRQWPHDLDPLLLPALTPGPLEQLAFLVERLPERSLYTFVQAIVRQYKSRAPIAFVAPADMASAVLERLLLLAPLVLPPGRRLAFSGAESRPLRLRTRGRLESEPAVDLLGVPHDIDLDSSMFRGLTMNLAGNTPIAPPTDSYGLAYTQWLIQTLEKGDWDALGAFYARYPVGGSGDPLESFSKPAPQPVNASLQEDSDEYFEQAFSERQLLWKAREQAEKVMDDLSKHFQKDLEQLTETLQFELEKASQEQEKKITNLENSVSRRSHNIQKRIDSVEEVSGKEYQQAVDRLKSMEKSLFTSLEQAAEQHRKNLKKAADRQQEKASKIFEGWRQKLKKEFEDQRVEFGRKASEVEGHLSRVRDDIGGEAPELLAIASEPDPSDQEDQASTWTPGAAAARPWWKDRRWAIAAAAPLVIAAGVYGWLYLGQNDPTPGPGPDGPLPPPPPARGIDKEIEDRATQLLAQGIAVPVLTVARGRRDLEDWEEAVVATRILGETETWEAKESCTLLQAALGITIDGGCGKSSKEEARRQSNIIRPALGQDLVTTPIPKLIDSTDDTSLKEDAPFVIRSQLRLSGDCQISWPIAFSGRCALSGPGARRLVDLAKKVYAKRGGATGPTLKKIATEEQYLGEGQTSFPPETGATLVRIALRLCTEEQDLGAEASSLLPTLEKLKEDKTILKRDLAAMEPCLVKLQQQHQQKQEQPGA